MGQMDDLKWWILKISFFHEQIMIKVMQQVLGQRYGGFMVDIH